MMLAFYLRYLGTHASLPGDQRFGMNEKEGNFFDYSFFGYSFFECGFFDYRRLDSHASGTSEYAEALFVRSSDS